MSARFTFDVGAVRRGVGGNKHALESPQTTVDSDPSQLSQLSRGPSSERGIEPSQLTVSEWDDYEERAAILEYDAGLARTEAEERAWNEIFAARESKL